MRTKLLLLTLAATTIALSPQYQASPPKPLPIEPLENYDDGPAPLLLRPNSSSPQMISHFGDFISYQVNVDSNGQNIVGDAANEPSICVDPTNPMKMTIGWRQFDSVRSNFRQAGWAYTTNGGTSWTFPGVLESNVFRSDPVLNSDATGQFFYLSLLQSYYDNMWRSLDGGQTWTNIAPAEGSDKEWFTIDNTSSSGHGFQYQDWSTQQNKYGGKQFTRSTDGGFTWLNPPINIPNSPAWGTLDVDSNGTLFLSGVNLNTGQIWCTRSITAKNGAVIPTFDQSTAVNLGGAISSGEKINPAGLTGQTFVAVDRSGTSTNNNVYVLASVQPTAAQTGADVMFVRSANGGQSFGPPVRINDDPINQNKWHWFGTLAVAPTGRIDVVWLDSRNAANNTDSQLFYSYSSDGGNIWSPNVAVSQPFNPFLGYPNQDKMGDYITIVSDDTGGNVAYCATFNQEEDIYYVRVAPPTGSPTPTPTPNSATATQLTCSPNPSVVGQSVTCTSTTTSTAGVPAGSVTFAEGSNVFASNVVVDGSGRASFSTSALSGGSHTITAAFTGSTGWANSSGNATQSVADFTVAPHNSSLSTKQGQSTQVQITVTPVNGFTGTVTLSVTGTWPNGLSATFNPTSITRSGNSNLTFTPNGTPAGTYPITVTGTSGGVSHSTTVNLTVNLGGNISMSVNPATVTVSRSTNPSGTTLITITSSNGFAGNVALTANGLPNGGSIGFNPSSVGVSPGSPGSSTVTLSVSPTTNTGNSNVNVTGNSGSGGPNSQTKVTLQVGN